MTIEKVILVDEQDNAIGEMEKLEAHQKGLLHRAFSVFIFNNKGQMLLQQRALSKYHSAGLWTNTCCSHPFPNEDTKSAAKRRLMEEMGMHAEIEYKNFLIYKTKFENGLFEHEYDHLFIGKSDQQPKINKTEVENFEWLTLEEIKEKIKLNPEQFTHWFKLAIEKFF
jgi:isopentenyl-diphosphate delta-isomerase